MSKFTDEDLWLLKKVINTERVMYPENDPIRIPLEISEALVSRLEAAEQAVEMARRVETGLPEPTSWKYFHLLWIRWKEAAGKG